MCHFKKLGILLLALGLASCATIEKEATVDDNAYLGAKTVPAAQTPPDLKINHAQNYYPVPPITDQGAPIAQPSVQPPGTVVQVQARPMPRQVAQNVGAARGASAVSASSTNGLVLNLNYAQAWSRVGGALRASGYKIMQQDSGLGAYYVLDLAGTGGELKTNTPIYQVHLSAAGNNTSVTLLNAQNHTASPAVSARILGALKRHL